MKSLDHLTNLYFFLFLSDLVYSIRGQNVGIFSVDSADGVIRVLNKKILDYENLPNVSKIYSLLWHCW